MARDVSNSGSRPDSPFEDERGAWKLALDHAKSRNARIIKVFCYLSVMRAAGWVVKSARVRVSPDSVDTPQDWNSTGGNQSAHCMPGFIAIEGPDGICRGIWDFAPDKVIGKNIYSLFESTDDLPANYNRADTAAEGWVTRGPRGLKQELETCCQNLVNQDPPRSKMTGEIYLVVDEPSVMAVWSRWARESVSIYKSAAAAKELRTAEDRPHHVPSAPVTDLSRGALNEWTPEGLQARYEDNFRKVTGVSTVADYKDQASFLHYYQIATPPHPEFINGAVREVHEAFSRWKAAQAALA